MSTETETGTALNDDISWTVNTQTDDVIASRVQSVSVEWLAVKTASEIDTTASLCGA